MVCINRSGPDDPLPPEDIARLHQIWREALAHERELREVIATTGLADDESSELTQRLTALKALASGFLSDS